MLFYYKEVDLSSISEQDLFKLNYSGENGLLLEIPKYISKETEYFRNFYHFNSLSIRNLSVLEKAYIRRAFYWYHLYKPENDSSNLEQVKGYLKAFENLSKANLWKLASSVFLNTSINNRELHKQLGIWGFYDKQILGYKNLLYKVDMDVDTTCLRGLGSAYYCTGKYKESRLYYNKLLEVSRATQSLKNEAHALGGIGCIYAQEMEKNASLNYHRQQLEIARKIGDLQEETQALNGIGFVYFLQGKYEKALQVYQEGLKLSHKIHDPDLIIKFLGGLGFTYASLGQAGEALEYLHLQLQVSEQTSNQYEKWVALNNIGINYIYLKQYQKAIDFFDEAICLVQEFGNSIGEQISLGNIGIAYALNQEHEIALEYLEESLSISFEYKYKAGGLVATNLAYCYGCLNNHEKAIDYSLQAISIAKDLEDAKELASAIATQANTYLQKKNFVKALVLICQSLIICPPWQNARGKLILRTALEETKRLIKRYLNLLKVGALSEARLHEE